MGTISELIDPLYYLYILYTCSFYIAFGLIKSQGIIGILIVTTEGGPQHHHQLEIEVEVEGARSSIEDEVAHCRRQ